MSEKEQAKFDALSRIVEEIIFSNHDVICTTCNAAFDMRLLSQRFKFVIIDEATQACEPDNLLPLLQGAEKLVLVGDQNQLGPISRTQQALLIKSMFERLLEQGLKPLLL